MALFADGCPMFFLRENIPLFIALFLVLMLLRTAYDTGVQRTKKQQWAGQFRWICKGMFTLLLLALWCLLGYPTELVWLHVPIAVGVAAIALSISLMAHYVGRGHPKIV